MLKWVFGSGVNFRRKIKPNICEIVIKVVCNFLFVSNFLVIFKDMFWCRRFVYGVVKNALYCVPCFPNVLFVFVEFVTVICLFCFSDILFQNFVACP